MSYTTDLAIEHLNRFITCEDCGMKTDYEEFPEYAEGEMNHWDGCNQLRPEDYYDNQTD